MFKSDEGILYYSANEIASILNEPKTIEEEEFCAKWN